MDFGTVTLNPVAAIGAALGGGAINALSQGKANQANEDIANNQMNFQREMSDTAHQREVKDLRKAGLNPYLTSTGQGASTPSGASANMQAPQINMPDLMAYGVSLKQLEQGDKTLQQGDKKLLIEAINSATDRQKLQLEKDGTFKGIIQELRNSGKDAIKKLQPNRLDLLEKDLSNRMKKMLRDVKQPSIPVGGKK